MEIKIEIADNEAVELLSYAESVGEDLNATLARWLTSGYLMDAYNGVMVPVIGKPENKNKNNDEIAHPIHVTPDIVGQNYAETESVDNESIENAANEETKITATNPVKKKDGGIKIHKKND